LVDGSPSHGTSWRKPCGDDDVSASLSCVVSELEHDLSAESVDVHVDAAVVSSANDVRDRKDVAARKDVREKTGLLTLFEMAKGDDDKRRVDMK
jgi:hypothetical protein